jgi:hypothetical protein
MCSTRDMSRYGPALRAWRALMCSSGAPDRASPLLAYGSRNARFLVIPPSCVVTVASLCVAGTTFAPHLVLILLPLAPYTPGDEKRE